MLTKKLSDKQIEAVNAIDEDVEIIACAGAGKTGIVTHRIVNILKSKPDVLPENIVAFTFTKKVWMMQCRRLCRSVNFGQTITICHHHSGILYNRLEVCEELKPHCAYFFVKLDILDI